MHREKINDALKDAMRAKQMDKVTALRTINAAIKYQDIAARTDVKAGDPASVQTDAQDDERIIGVLQKLVKQHRDSIASYQAGNRLDLVTKEQVELELIESFLPQMMNIDEIKAAVIATISKLSATTIKDMGRVMATLRADYGSRMDYGQAGIVVKGLL